MKIEVDQPGLASAIEALGSISDAEAPAVTRIVFSPTDLIARAWLKARCEDAGLAVRQDPIGNTFARWTGSDLEAPAVGTGSHIDAIPNAGKYDGVVGVLGGLKRFEHCRGAGFARPIRSSFSCSLQRSRRVSASGASVAECSRALFLMKQRRS